MLGFIVHTGSSTLFLPQELSEKILQYLKVDISSLTSSALVCKSWAHVSRSSLFRTLTFKPDFAQRFGDIISSVGLGTRAFTTLPLAAYCKILHIRDVSQTHHSPSESNGLQSLYLTITTLTLSQCSYASLPEFFICISNFVNLKNLTLHEVRWTKNPTRERTCLPPAALFTSVTTLNAHKLDWHQFMGCVNQHELFPNVRHLRLGPTDEFDATPIMQYLFRVSSNLRRLSVSFASRYERDDVSGMAPTLPELPAMDLLALASSVDTSQGREGHLTYSSFNIRDEYRRIWGVATSVYVLPKMDELRIEEFVNVHKGPMQPAALFWTPRTVTSLIVPNLRRIELGLIIERTGQLDQYEINWNFLDHVLNSADYSSLERVVFRTDGAVDMGSLENLLSMRMPLTARRGLLEVCQAGDDYDWE